MKTLRKQMASDFIRLGRTPFFLLHLVIPLIGITLFLIYLGISNHATESLTINYHQTLTVVYPLLAAWLCSLVTEQEIEAGGGFYFLSQSGRGIVLGSKLLFLVFSGLAACLLSVIGYSYVAVFVKSGYTPSLSALFTIVFVIWGCAIFEYLLHTWLGLRSGRNVSFAVAAIEILLSALMLTGLGDTIWFIFPSAWGIRFVSYLSRDSAVGNDTVLSMVHLGILTAAVVTLIMLIFLFLWLQRWEGRKNEE